MTPEVRAAKLVTQLALVDKGCAQRRVDMATSTIREAVAEAKAEEREECARVAETQWSEFTEQADIQHKAWMAGEADSERLEHFVALASTTERIATAIRSRGEDKG